jgi:hypothetical protein
MHSLRLHTSAATDNPPDLNAEVARLETLLTERRRELSERREELHAFKARYTQVVGGCLAELAEIERAIKEAEARLLGLAESEGDEHAHVAETDVQAAQGVTVKKHLRKLFWSVARMFHPDHASDEQEAGRRHTIMAEASRAYREGDIESLHTLLGDEQLQSYCASAHAADEPPDLPTRLMHLKEELRTVEFGLKRIRQDGMYQIKLKVDEEARQGRDALAATAQRIRRQIVKARHRLANLDA